MKLYSAKTEEMERLQAICDLWQQEAGFWGYNLVRDALAQPNTYLLYRENDQGQWMVAALFRVAGDESDLAYLYTVAEFRGRGFATRHLKECMRWLKARHKVSRIVLEVRPSNEPALKTYYGLGMTVVGHRPKYYADGEDALLLAGGVADV